MPQSPTIFRSYRIYLRDARNAIGQSYDVDLTSDEEAHDRALVMLGGQVTYSYSEVWERARLVCTVRKGSNLALRKKLAGRMGEIGPAKSGLWTLARSSGG